MKKLSILVLIFLLTFTSCGGSETETVETMEAAEISVARVMSIFQTDGNAVNISRGAEREFIARTGTNLYEGYAVSTGEESFCDIILDTSSLVKMDEHSQVSVERATNTSLLILLERGQILAHIQRQAPEHELEVRAGNVVLGVRGTLFAVSLHDDYVQVVMLEGSVETDSQRILNAGEAARIFDDGTQRTYEVSEIIIEELDAFILQAILDYREQLTGIFTPEIFETVASLLEPEEEREPIPDYITIQGEQFSTSLTVLDLRDRRLTDEDITDLRYMVNLTELNLMNSLIFDITPLSGLTNLTSLAISGGLTDISPLSNLTNLTWLNIYLDGDITPLSDLTNLENLRLFVVGELHDITPLSNLTNLATLNLSFNRITDITPLSNLTNLTVLNLDFIRNTDITPLSNLTNLTELNLSNNSITDIAPLSNLTNLNTLRMGGNQITNWSPVAHVPNVEGRP